jgi:hypothetical protein
MSETPTTYDASQTYIAEMDFARITEPPVHVRAKEDFELFFFADPAMLKVEGALRGWMLHTEEIRARMVKDTYLEPKDANGIESNLSGPGRTKSLLWILYQEATKPGGSRVIATAAFKALFPQKA